MFFRLPSFFYYSFIRPRTDPDTRHWLLQSDIATTRPLARCWKPTAIVIRLNLFSLPCVINIRHISSHKMTFVGLEPQ